MRKCFLIVLVLTAMLSFTSLAQAAPQVVLDGQTHNFDVQPIIESGSTLIPLRTILEAMGCQVSWNSATQTVTITDPNIENIAYFIGLAKYGPFQLNLEQLSLTVRYLKQRIIYNAREIINNNNIIANLWRQYYGYTSIL